MNKRQKKKLYKKRIGCNPSKEMMHSVIYHCMITGRFRANNDALNATLLQPLPLKYEHEGRLYDTPGEALHACLERVFKPLEKILQKFTQNHPKWDSQYVSNTKNIVNAARILSRHRRK